MTTPKSGSVYRTLGSDASGTSRPIAAARHYASTDLWSYIRLYRTLAPHAGHHCDAPLSLSLSLYGVRFDWSTSLIQSYSVWCATCVGRLPSPNWNTPQFGAPSTRKLSISEILKIHKPCNQMFIFFRATTTASKAKHCNKDINSTTVL